MLIDKLQHRLFSSPTLRPALKNLEAGDDSSIGLVASVRPFLVASLFARNPRPMLVIVSGQEAAERFARALAAYLGRSRVLLFPERVDLPWQDKKPDLAVIGARTRALGELSLGRPLIVVASARACMRKMASASSRPFSPLVIQRDECVADGATGELLEYEDLTDALVKRGYQRLDELDGPGTFSVAGDTVDIFGAGTSAPVRVEFFGDEVDGLRTVVASTGQTIGEVEHAEIWPAREFEVSKSGIARAKKELAAALASDEQVVEEMQHLEDGTPFNRMGYYAPYLYSSLDQPISHVSSDALIVLCEPRSLFDDATRRYDELLQLAGEARINAEKLEAYFSAPAKMDFGSQQRLTLLSIMRAGGKVDADLAIERPTLAGHHERLYPLVRNLVGGGTTTLFSVPDRHARADVKLEFTDNSIAFTEALDGDDAKLDDEHLNITDIDVPSGFIIPDAHLALLSLGDLTRRGTGRPQAKHVDITEITFPFQPGDYVVHEKHGIALFKGLVKRDFVGKERAYLLLEYAEDDKLYVPVERIDRVTRYVGPDGSNPRLTKLNSADWARTVKKARKSAKKLAFDLVDLYARRSSVKGFAYGEDTVWQEEMEQIFPYEETPDQLSAIADVKADMESDKPMDRLICGDVGFGKTEVALRAAFKAVSNQRQVMILCPTTILAQQHYDTFSDRFSPFGIKVEVLSRFRSAKEQKGALKGFAEGSVDVLVGTHRLLSRDVNPKNLGLVIIDEEQRFGVGHKEQLKNMRESVDVLTLSATPIPRTLQMSLSGVRDMSLITTPPPNRRPVKVHVGEWDEDIVSGAIRREMERGGQTYYVSNRVRTIDDALARVQQAAPEARIGVAHGQMSARQVEAVMEQFSAGELDVLIATTIVESGIDNPHTNTLIIEDSQRLGLAQLYQLKGRVGRSVNQAYAYFLFPKNKPLTQEATERLQAIGEFTDLGSGMKVAMKDLEIRGAGTLLGAEQSGNMSAVGFDLFASMLAQAVSDARGEDAIAHEDVRVDLAANFFIPEEYMPAADERVLFYRRLAAAVTTEDVERVRSQMEQGYGELPEPAANMCTRARIKALAADCGVTSILQKGGKVVIEPVPNRLKAALSKNTEAKQTMERLRALYFAKSEKYTVPLGKEGDPLEIALEAVEALAKVAEENR
ncbi:MAG: transcription-repair coupling factor [Coriobacteriales bacterium]